VASVPALKPFQGLVKLVEGCCVTLFFVVSILYIRHTWLVLGLTNTVLGHQRAVEQRGVRYKVWINKTLKVDGCIKKNPQGLICILAQTAFTRTHTHCSERTG